MIITSNSVDSAEAAHAAQKIAAALGIDTADTTLCVTGNDPVLPVRYPLGVAAAGVFGACGAGLASLARLRGMPSHRVVVDLEHAALSLVSFRHLRLDGAPIGSPGDANPLVGLYRCRDGNWIAIHGGFPSLEQATLAVLGCAGTRPEIETAIAARDSGELEDALARKRMCGVVVRTEAQWLAHPQGRQLLASPLVEVERVSDAVPTPLAPATRPLDGVRVADFTRILAGPICSRFLAAAGADVLTLAAPHLPDVSSYALETSHGKRSAWLDLDANADQRVARDLIADCDVVVDSYRPGAMDKRGLGPAAMAGRARGGVYVSINCYGWSGDWVARPGWEMMGQAATGLAAGHGSVAQPVPLWTYPCDYLTGYLGGLGATVALMRRAREGGSYHVRVSLCRTGMYAAAFGVRYDQVPPPRDVAAVYLSEVQTPRGRLRYLPIPCEVDGFSLGWDRFAANAGSDAARWR